jgi:hypothetical protein
MVQVASATSQNNLPPMNERNVQATVLRDGCCNKEKPKRISPLLRYGKGNFHKLKTTMLEAVLQKHGPLGKLIIQGSYLHTHYVLPIIPAEHGLSAAQENQLRLESLKE